MNQDNFQQQFLIEESGESDIKHYLFLVIQNWKWFALSIVIFLTGAYLVNRYTTPQYSVSGTLLIKESKKNASDEILKELDFFNSSVNIDNEIAVLKSYSLTRQVVDSLNLFVSVKKVGRFKSSEIYKEQSPFDWKIKSSYQELSPLKLIITVSDQNTLTVESINPSYETNQSFSIAITEPFQNEEFDLWIDSKELSNITPGDVYEIAIGDPEKAAKELRKQLQINQYNKEASIVKISLESPNQLKSKAVIHLMMQCYINRELQLKNEKAKRTVEFIDKQLSGIQTALNQAETEMVDFRTKNSLIDISKEGEAIYTKLQALEKQAQDIDLKLDYYHYLQTYLNQPKQGESVVSPSTVGITDPPLTSLIVQYNELKNQLIISDSYASEINPQVQSIKSQMNSVKEIITENINNLINATQLTQTNLKRQIQVAEHELDQLPGSERKLINIQRQFNLNDNLYVYLLEKKAEAGIALASTVASTEILDEPLLDARTRPKSLKNYLLALVLGLFIPFGFLILKEFFINTIQDSTEIEKHTSLPILSSIALSHKNEELVMNHYPRSRTSESFRNMRASLKYLMPENKNNHSIMFTSFTSGDGKTFCAMNTAVMMAQAGYKTILLGLDLRRPKIYDTFNLENSIGVSNLLLSNGEKESDNFIYNSNIENLDIILSGPTPPLPNELFMRDSFKNLMQDLSQNYEFIIIDTPPVGLVSDAFEISKYADTTLFVVRHQQTPKKAIDFLKDTQTKKLINNLGILYNGVDYQKLTSYYGYDNKKYNAYYED
ncbi:MAG: hypothetical protein CMB80_27810 [Flammeovirgaceae bacterium]|nr:hypothetical protein [Flammeovirgaceae bacterium]